MSAGICKHRPCKKAIPEGRTDYCCAQHRKRAKHKRTPSHKRYQQRKNADRATPYSLFVAAAKARKQLRKHKSEKAQATAREIVAHGGIAYENREGLIRDIGAPKDPADSGRVFSAVEVVA